MRILVVSPALPYPPNWGFGIRVYETVRLLARRHDVTLLAYGSPEDGANVAALEKICRVRRVDPQTATGAGKRVGQLVSMLSPQSFTRRNHYSAAMQGALDELSSGPPFDVIQVEASPMAGFRFDPRSAVVLTEHDIVYELLYRMYQTETSIPRRLYNRIEYAKFRRAEIDTWRNVAAVVTTSAREERIIHDIVPGAATLAAPNGVDVEHFHPSSEPVDPNAIVMTGFMKTRPNIDGAVYFIREILPRVLAKRPATVFSVVGGGVTEEVTQLAGPNVVVTGQVPDVRPYVWKSAVFVVPLRMGGGTRLKVLEGLSMRKAMVSTSLGCEGIDVVDREHLLIRDTPDSFADGVVELLEGADVGRALAERGHDMVKRRYQWSAIVDRLEGFYEELLRKRAAR